MANFAELRLFGKALANSKYNATLPITFIKDCAEKGYVIHPNCDIYRVQSFVHTLPYNYNSTFYNSFQDVTEKSRFELFIDQITHYASTYGTNHMGTPYIPNDSPESVIDFTDCKVIQPITLDEIKQKIQDMLSSNIALKTSTLDDIFELIEEFDFNIDISTIKNREAILRYKMVKDLPANNVKEMMQMINCVITGSPMIVKDGKTILQYSNSLEMEQSLKIVNIMSHFTPRQIATIFNRYKPLFLALRNSEGASLKTFVNKISKLSKKHHVPTILPVSTVFLTKEYLTENELKYTTSWFNENLYYNNFSLFQLSKWYTAVKKRQQGEFLDTFNIRNGKSYIKTNNWNLSEIERYNLNNWEQIISRAIAEKLYNKVDGKTIKIKKDFSLTMPTSEKNFIGTLPLGSYIDIKPQDNLIVGINWKGADGAQDLDLSFTDIDGNIVSWCNSYRDNGANVVYSGDMTSANPEATECLLFHNDMPNGVFKVSNYSQAIGAKYTFFVAKHTKDTFGMNHMVDPNDIIFQTPLEFGTDMEMSMAIYVDGRFIFTDRATNKHHIAIANITTTDLIQSQIDMSNMTFNLSKHLKWSSAILCDENHTGDCVDLTTNDKSTLISLLS